LSASDEVRLGTATVVTGHVLLDDAGHAEEPPSRWPTRWRCACPPT
jgi:hypothetical protein